MNIRDELKDIVALLEDERYSPAKEKATSLLLSMPDSQPDLPCVRRDPATARDKEIIELAQDEFQDEGTIEIDDNATISEANEVNGCYVQAWVFVCFGGTTLDKDLCATPGCKNPTDNGEGYDGYCGTCADRKEVDKPKPTS